MTAAPPQSETSPTGGAGNPSGIGRALRLARETRGLTVGDAAHALKLIPRQVEAMEAEAFERLPGVAFSRGFLRNYARFLQLDAEALVAEFDATHAGAVVELRQVSNAQGALPAGGGRRPSAMPAAVAAAGLLGLVVAGWYFDWFRQPELPVSVEVAPPEAAPVVVAPNAEPVPVAPVAVAPADGTAQPVSAAPAMPPAAQPAEGAQVAAVAAPVAEVIPPVQPVAAPAVGAKGPDGLDRLTFNFGKEAWVEVRDASGAIIYSRINPAGAAQEVQGKGPFALVVGNAQSVTVTHNGQPVDLGPHTKVSVARLTVQ